jgi:WW domain
MQRRGSAQQEQLLNLAFEGPQPLLQGRNWASASSSSIGQQPSGDAGTEYTQQHVPEPVPVDVFREGVRQQAALLGMVLPEDSRYLWIAEESMLADLPAGWVTLCDESSNGRPYFWHAENQESSWEHPRDEFYRQLFTKRKADDVHSGIAYTAPAAEYNTYSTALPNTPPPLPAAYEGGNLALSYVQTELDAAKLELERKRERITALSAECQERTAVLQRTVAELEHKLEVSEDAAAEAQRTARSAAAERDKLDKAYSRQKDRGKELQSKLDSAERRAHDLQADMEELRTACEAQLADAARAAAAQARQLEASLTAAASDAAAGSDHSLDSARAAWQEERQSLLAALDRAEVAAAEALSAERAQLQRAQQQALAKADFQVAERVREGVEAVRRELQTRDETVVTLQLQVAEVRAAAAAAAGAAEQRQELLQAAVAAGASPQLTAAQERLVRLEGALASSEERAAALLLELADKSAVSKAAAAAKREMEAAQFGMREANERFDAELARLNDDLAEAERIAEDRSAGEYTVLTLVLTFVLILLQAIDDVVLNAESSSTRCILKQTIMHSVQLNL